MKIDDFRFTHFTSGQGVGQFESPQGVVRQRKIHGFHRPAQHRVDLGGGRSVVPRSPMSRDHHTTAL